MVVYLTSRPFGSSFKFNGIQMKCLFSEPKKKRFHDQLKLEKK